jgi:aryl-alcohol dehydrogenase-like predicted oxidoreductase
MPMSEFYGPIDLGAYQRTVHRAVELGVTLFDTAAAYGAPRFGEAANEETMANALAGVRDQIALATKCGVVCRGARRVADNSPGHIRRAIDESLTRLRTDYIDLFYLHRRDPRVPVEEAVGVMAELVIAGKVRHLGISEVAADTLRRAHETHPMAALQSEYSLLTRHLESGILETTQELGIGLVAYAPLGRALLTDRLQVRPAPGDLRHNLPRFRESVFAKNLKLVGQLSAYASGLGCSTTQLALAWLLAKGTNIVPIPSARSVDHLEENLAAVDIRLTAEQVGELDRLFPIQAAIGERNTPEALALMNL